MSPTHLLQAIWALLVLWYILERMLLVKGRIAGCPAWHNPARSARESCRALWDSAPVGWAFLATLFAAHALACLGRSAWSCADQGWPRTLADPCLTALVSARPAPFLEALRSGEYWACRWRELLDAALAYPAFQPSLEPAAALLVAGVAVWALRRGVIPGPERPRSRTRALVSLWSVGVGLFAAIFRALLQAGRLESPPDVTHQVGLFLGLIAVPVIAGGALGLLALLAARIVLALPVRAEGLVADWLDRLPRFVALVALPAGATVLAGWFVKDWQMAPHPNATGLAAGLFVASRIAWIVVLPGVLRLAVQAGPSRAALAEFARLVRSRPGGVLVLMLRSAAALAPVLVLLGLLETLAPTSALIPGAVVALARWCLAFAVLAGALALHRDLQAVPSDDA